MVNALSKSWSLAISAVFLSVLPLVLPDYYLYLATELLIWALFALSLDLLLGYTGLPSFGHAIFFGIPAYAVGIILTAGYPLIVALLVAVVAASLTGLILGYLATRTGGIGYIIVTLLASFAVFLIAFSWTNLTGGENGLYISRAGTLAALSTQAAYAIVAVSTALIFLGARWLVRSNYGLLLVGIKTNETRAQAMGYNTQLYKFQITIVSAMIAGVAGVLYALLARSLSAELVGPELSTEAVIWVLLGGTQTLLGPMLGAALFILIKQALNTIRAYPIFLGLLFIVVVVWAPSGLLKLPKGLWKSFRRRNTR
ncbi:MAG: branched-chain amino acid ABC transporter permease [Rhizobiales bacterium]|nr:branched-chain amino acid ABC transporter permease [Hyphomicrobiales bacterium]